MKYFPVRSVFCCAIALVALLRLSAEEQSAGSWNEFRKHVRDSKCDVIKVTKDFSLGGSVAIPRNLTIYSDRSGIKTISNNNSYTITISPDCALDLSNIVFTASDRSSHKADVFHLTEINEQGKIARMRLHAGAKISNFKIVTEADADHAVIHVKKGARFVLNDGAEILNCRNNSAHGNGGAICCDSGNVIINGGVIAGCSAKGAGGAIRSTGERIAAEDNIGLAMRGDIYLYGGYITNNVCGDGATADAEAYGGGIYLGYTGPMLHVIGPAVVSNNVCKAGGKTVPDDVSTYLLHDDFANRLKLSMDEHDLMFTNGWIGVRYPDMEKSPGVQVQSTRFGAVWEYTTRFQDEARQFFWNGDNHYRGWMSGNALVWSRFHMHELPKDGIRITTLLEDSEHSGGPIYVELNDDYEMLSGDKDHATVPRGRELFIDLQGFHLKCDLHVEPGGKVTILDSSTNRAGTVEGHRKFDGDIGTEEWKNAFELQGGSYHDQPPPEWIAPGRILIGNYCEVHPWMVARLAWETNLVSRLEDVTKVPLSEVDNEVRVVEMTENGQKTDLGAIVFSPGDWRRGESDNPNLKAEIIAVPAVRNEDGSLEECGGRITLYRTGGDVSHGNAGLGSEDAYNWSGAAAALGLIKLIHITTKTVGETVTTNAIETAYFKFPDAIFHATQRKMGAGKLPITVVDALLASLGYNRAEGFNKSDVDADLDKEQVNGLRRWENIVTGTAENQLLLSTAEEVEGGLALNVALVDAEAKNGRNDTGYHVRYDLRKYDDGNKLWKSVGEIKESPNFSIQLLDEANKSVGATGFYRLTTLIIPDDTLSVTNEIPSTNIVGVLEVASKLTNTLAAVPWVELAADPQTADEKPTKVSKYLNTSHLKDKDSVQVADKGRIYWEWKWNKSGKKWEGSTTVTKEAVLDAPSADVHELPRDSAVWVTRDDPAAKPFFLIGQYSSASVSLAIAGGSLESPGCTLVPNPCIKAVKVNDYKWGENPRDGDYIRIPNEKKAPHVLRWKNGQWGRLAGGVWKNDAEIPAGTGFWYMRCAGGPFQIELPKSVLSAE